MHVKIRPYTSLCSDHALYPQLRPFFPSTAPLQGPCHELCGPDGLGTSWKHHLTKALRLCARLSWFCKSQLSNASSFSLNYRQLFVEFLHSGCRFHASPAEALPPAGHSTSLRSSFTQRPNLQKKVCFIEFCLLLGVLKATQSTSHEYDGHGTGLGSTTAEIRIFLSPSLSLKSVFSFTSS